MDLSVVAAAREDETSPLATVEIARTADRLGYGEVWLGEGPTWDSFALATAVGLRTRRIALTAGPIPVHVRDPFSIARGASSVAALVGRPVGVALGTSSTRVVEGVHGRERDRPVAALAHGAAVVADLLGPRTEAGRTPLSAHGFRWRLPPGRGPLTVAAFGERAVAVAVEHADRMLLDLVSPGQVRVLRERRDIAARRAGRTPPRLAAWVPAAVDPTDRDREQVLRSIVGYLTVRGYSDMFVDAGFGRAVELAASGVDTDRLLAELPAEAAGVVGLVGSLDAVRTRFGEYTAAGLDEIAVFPTTAGDPAGERTLAALAGLAGIG
ncbi:MAG TPA: LLM class F420-dependent oxidoreductase [Streptosporangiales bacterium]